MTGSAGTSVGDGDWVGTTICVGGGTKSVGALDGSATMVRDGAIPVGSLLEGSSVNAGAPPHAERTSITISTVVRKKMMRGENSLSVTRQTQR